MKISCPSCSAKYSIADEKVQNRLAKIRCRKCGTSIVIDGNVSPANVYAGDSGAVADPGAGAADPGAAPPAPAAAAAAAGVAYSVDLGENDQRQMTTPEIVEAYNAGTVTAETFVWADGFADWTALGQVEELVAALHAAAHQDSPTAPTDETSAAAASAAPEESPWDQGAASPGAPAAGSPDLFGNVANAGSVDDQPVAAAAPAAADPSPFGGGAAPAADDGARNESSVLFSLSALTSSAGTSRPSMPAPAASSTGNSEDSGLIDLKALTAAAEATQNAPAAAAAPVQAPIAAAAPLGGAPLGGAPLAGAGGPSIPPPAAKSNNNAMIIGGFLLVGIIAAAAIVTLGGKEEEAPIAPPAAPVAAPTAPVAPTPAPIPTAETKELPTADAKPPSTGAEDEEKAPSAKPAAGPKTSYKPRPKPSGTSSSKPSSSPKPKPKPKASVGKCGCKKDDLMCLMNCAQ